MKHRYLLFIPLLVLASCEKAPIKERYFYFDTWPSVTLYDGDKNNADDVRDIMANIDKESNNYVTTNTLYQLNNSEESVTISSDLYKLLKRTIDLIPASKSFFNPRLGSLSKKWKEALANNQILSEAVINEELDKMRHTSLSIGEKDGVCTAKKTGQGEVDLGGIAKGYTLDLIKDYLDEKNLKQYLIDCGSSSILLGEKPTKDGEFTIGLNIPGLEKQKTIKAKNTFIGASGSSEQGVKIDGVTYSHIINPFTGSAVNKYDFVLVKGDNGALVDVLTTSFIMMELDDIKTIEKECNVQTIIYNNKELIYKSDNI